MVLQLLYLYVKMNLIGKIYKENLGGKVGGGQQDSADYLFGAVVRGDSSKRDNGTQSGEGKEGGIANGIRCQDGIFGTDQQ